MDFKIDGPYFQDNSWVVESILRALPEWFGIEEMILHYCQFVAENATLYALVDDRVVGFLSLKRNTLYTAEVYVMGVLPEYHRYGIGRALMATTEDWLRTQGVEYLQVKTLADTHPDPGYAKTRAFYERMGFRPLDVFPALWNEENPCLVMVKRI